MSKLNINRRNFLKAAGVAAGVGTVAAGAAVVAPAVAKADYNQPSSTLINLAITYLDEPSYNLPPYADADKLERFSYDLTSFENPTLQAEVFAGLPWYYPMGTNKQAKLQSGEPGFSLRDIAFATGSGYNFDNPSQYIWEAAGTSDTELVGKWEDTPENNALSVKKAAYFYGSRATGVCLLNRQWVYTKCLGKDVVFKDVESPEETDTEQIIPESITHAIVVAIPMDGSVVSFGNVAFGGASPDYAYSQMAETVSKLATFIKCLGYNAIPLGTYTTMKVPMAIEAGLGELGRHGLLINPEFGSNMRIAAVITDLPMAVDKPITFGAANFCKTCMKCAEMCPSKSISFDEEPSYDIQCEGNNPGMKKWYVNTHTCLEYWVSSGSGCRFCQRVCTYSKQQTWVHDVVKVIASKTTAFNSIFSTMDDAFGYGQGPDTIDNTLVDEWWADPDERMFNWLTM